MDPRIPNEMHQNSIHGLSVVGEAVPGATVAHIGPWLLFDSGVEGADFNQALAVHPFEDPMAAIALAEDWYRARGVAFYLWLRDPHDLPLLDAAKAAGYSGQTAEPAMLLDSLPAAPLAVPGLDVRVVTGPEGAAAWDAADPRHAGDEALAAAVSQVPGVQLFVGYVGKVPVARSMVVVSGRMAGITNVYVAPSMRRRGFGAAMTSVAAAAGRQLGATAACLEASEMGRPVYERMGFRTIYSYVRLSPSQPRTA